MHKTKQKTAYTKYKHYKIRKQWNRYTKGETIHKTKQKTEYTKYKTIIQNKKTMK